MKILILLVLAEIICTKIICKSHTKEGFFKLDDVVQVPFHLLQTNRAATQKTIVDIHNRYRANVKPTAANMLRMTWHKGAAKNAQKWANSCVYLKHNANSQRQVPNYGTCGQNIFVSTAKLSWSFAIKQWHDEQKDFYYGYSNHTDVVGHYTQMVWSTSHKIGCGIAKCLQKNGKTFYNYICDYCPTGNIKSLANFPYRKAKTCSACKGHCRRKLCTNSCPFINKYSNCLELYRSNPKGFCKGVLKNDCKAVCKCPRQIYQRFDYGKLK